MSKTKSGVEEFLDSYAPKPKKAVKKEFEISEEMRAIAQEVIREHKLDVHPAKIEYLVVTPCISKTLAGKCIRSGKEFKFFTNFDYLIEVSGDLWGVLDTETKKILIEHELRHIIITQDDKTQDWKFGIRDHDVKDFACIISKHGIDWIHKVKLCISSLYDLSPSEYDNIKI